MDIPERWPRLVASRQYEENEAPMTGFRDRALGRLFR
jgi:hypothetical protein